MTFLMSSPPLQRMDIVTLAHQLQSLVAKDLMTPRSLVEKLSFIFFMAISGAI
jgi:hypothetical protein